MPMKVQKSPLPEPKPAADAAGGGSEAGETVNDIAAAVEAVLLSLDRPVALAKIADALGLGEHGAGASRVREAIEGLNAAYERTGRSFRIEQLAGGWRVMTLPAYAREVAAFHQARASARLSRAAVETLAVVAYRQPITRAEIEAIRGVACGEVLRTLLERRLVAIVGRAEELGRPMLYGTSRHFLELFGLASLKDLPSVGEFVAAATTASSAEDVQADSTHDHRPAEEST